MTTSTAPHRKPDLLLATISLVALLLPPTLALQLRAAQAGTEAPVEPVPVVARILLREDAAVESARGVPSVAGHFAGGIQRHL